MLCGAKVLFQLTGKEDKMTLTDVATYDATDGARRYDNSDLIQLNIKACVSLMIF